MREREDSRVTRVRPLVAFFVLTFAATWTLWTIVALLPSGDGAPDVLRQFLFLPGTVMPAIVALWIMARTEGRGALRSLADRLLKWDVAVRWYVFALGFMIAIKLLAAVAHRAAFGVWPAFGEIPVYLMLGAAILSTPVQAGEEIGWRGYALPRLASHVGLPVASIILGVIWAVWHLPLFYLPRTGSNGQSFLLYSLYVTPISVVMAWLYLRTGGSLLLVMLLHGAVNNTRNIVPAGIPSAADPMTITATPVAWLTVALLWLVALYFLLRLRGHTLPADTAASD